MLIWKIFNLLRRFDWLRCWPSHISRDIQREKIVVFQIELWDFIMSFNYSSDDPSERVRAPGLNYINLWNVAFYLFCVYKWTGCVNHWVEEWMVFAAITTLNWFRKIDFAPHFPGFPWWFTACPESHLSKVVKVDAKPSYPCGTEKVIYNKLRW